MESLILTPSAYHLTTAPCGRAGWRYITVLHQNDVYGSGYLTLLQTSALSFGLQIYHSASYESGDTDSIRLAVSTVDDGSSGVGNVTSRTVETRSCDRREGLPLRLECQSHGFSSDRFSWLKSPVAPPMAYVSHAAPMTDILPRRLLPGPRGHRGRRVGQGHPRARHGVARRGRFHSGLDHLPGREPSEVERTAGRVLDSICVPSLHGWLPTPLRGLASTATGFEPRATPFVCITPSSGLRHASCHRARC